MNLDKETNRQPSIDADEHADLDGHGAKKVITLDLTTGLPLDPRHLYGYDSDTHTWRPIEVVESTAIAGRYVLAVGNIDGSPITGGGGGTIDTANLLLQTGDNFLLETGDQLLLA